MVRLAPSVEAMLRRHCEEQYPNEACGALFGHGDGRDEAWTVTEVDAAPNQHDDDRKRRYLVAPDFQVRAERHARETAQDVLGFYHSHPDHPALPSEYDRAHAWFGYLYMICSVERGRSGALNAFTLDQQDGSFLDVDLRDEPGPAK